ncbi:MAG: alpha/beta hydrolase [Labilithrix sp.]
MRIAVGTDQLEVIRWPGGKPRVLYLHEGLGSARQWRDFPAQIGLDSYAYSRLGYGSSDPTPLPRPLDYMEREARDFVPRVLDALGLERAILFGHSDGGSIALLTAAAHPSRVEALVLEAPHAFVEDISVKSIAAAKTGYESGDLRSRLSRVHANVDIAFRGWNDAWLDPGFRSWNIEWCLKEVRVPVLLLQGEDDPYGTRAQVDAIARGVSATATVCMIPRCGHAPHRDAPDEVIARTKEFLATLSR